MDHRSIDYRSPVFAVASLSYSRAVNGIAATWLAVWREAHGDTTRMPKAREVEPARRPARPCALLPAPSRGTLIMNVKRALLSVFRKDGIVDLARELVARGVEIVSTGGTAAELQKGKVAVIEVSKATGFPEILDGRVKTLHPKIHGGILARRGTGRAREGPGRRTASRPSTWWW